jgi:hypothetical protein
MKVRSGHIRFEKKVQYKHLAGIFKTLYLRFLEESGQMPQDPEIVAVLLEENLMDLRSNRKPEGFNREGPMRMVFPITDGGVEFYVYGRGKTVEVARVTDTLSRLLAKHRLKHKVEWDRMVLYREDKPGAGRPASSATATSL